MHFDRSISLGSILSAGVITTGLIIAIDDIRDTADAAANGVQVLTKRVEGFHGSAQRNHNQLRATVVALEKAVAERSAHYNALLAQLQRDISLIRARR